MAAAIKSANSARPGSLKSPVPGDDMAAAAAAFMQKQAEGLPAAAPSVAEDEAYAPVEMPAETPQEPGLGGQILDGAGRALDYAGGIARAGIASVATAPQSIPGESEMDYQERLKEAPSIVTAEDHKQILKGKGPDTAEYLKRMGVPEGGSLKFGDTKVTVRGAAGLVGDIAADPLTLISKLAKAIPYIGKVLNAPGAASEALGEVVYKSALSRVDNTLAKKGTKPVSDVLIQEGAPVAGAQGLAEKVNSTAATIGKVRQGLYDKATELGVTIDTAYPLKRAEAVLSQMRKDPGLRPVAEELQELLGRYKAGGKVTVDMISEWKTNLYNALPANAFSGHGKLKTQAKQFKAALAGDFRDAIVQAGNKAEKGLGDAINALNDKWGTLIEASNAMKKGSPSAGKLGTMIDGAVLSTGGLSAAAVKKSYDIATSPYARTLVGKSLMQAGKTGFADAVARRSLVEANKMNQTTPMMLQDNETYEGEE